jgi:hypothetical protein
VGADAGEGEDALGRPGATLRRELELADGETHDRERGGELGLVRPLGEAGDRATLLYVIRPDGLVVRVDEAAPPPPGRGLDPLPDVGAERQPRDERRRAHGRPRGAGGQGERSPTRYALRGSLDRLLDRALLLLVAEVLVVALGLLLRHEARARHAGRARQRGEGEAEREPEQRVLGVDDEDDDEGHAAGDRRGEAGQHDVLGATVPPRLAVGRARGRGLGALDLAPVSLPSPPQQEDAQRQERPQDEVARPPHSPVRSASSRITSSSAVPARSQATIPSGIGPRWPMPQPPRSSGWRAYAT